MEAASRCPQDSSSWSPESRSGVKARQFGLSALRIFAGESDLAAESAPIRSVEDEPALRPRLSFPVHLLQEVENDDENLVTDDPFAAGTSPVSAAPMPLPPESVIGPAAGGLSIHLAETRQITPEPNSDGTNANEAGGFVGLYCADAPAIVDSPQPAQYKPAAVEGRVPALEFSDLGSLSPASEVQQTELSLELVATSPDHSPPPSLGPGLAARDTAKPDPRPIPHAFKATERVGTGTRSLVDVQPNTPDSDGCETPERTASPRASESTPDGQQPVLQAVSPSAGETLDPASFRHQTYAQVIDPPMNSAGPNAESISDSREPSASLSSRILGIDQLQRSPRVNHLQLQVEPSAGQRIDLRLSDRAGLIRVSARTSDTGIARELLVDLPQLQKWLEARGFDTVSAHVSSTSKSNLADRQELPDGRGTEQREAGQDRRFHHDQKHHGRQGTKQIEQWLSTMDRDAGFAGTTRDLRP